MSKKALSILWTLTGIVALGLLALTITIVIQTGALAETGIPGQVTDSTGAVVLLHAEPSRTATVITILEAQAALTVTDSQREDDVLWYQVQTEAGQGWVLARYVVVETQ
ncbi:MAG: SH3 domain-containing protein [Anaerolineales bacterium]|nr:SH3 domain-containing protein [Anaerolineales bacterium]